jgi:catechol 2,3-dioxygenase-like lactoylglutathione lyase family enzyme
MEKTKPALNLKFLSHGTLISRNLEKSKEFYQNFFGLEVVRTSPISLMIRMGGNHVYAVVENKKHDSEMNYLFHNGLDVDTDKQVDEAHLVATNQASKWGLTKISKPKAQHGTYSFYFWDSDFNCWEILSNPDRGYMWIFDKGDQEGIGHMDKNYDRSEVNK